MNSVCRLCLVETFQLLHVCESTAIPGWTTADAIRELLQMRVSASDVYPQFICTNCLGKLVDFKLFKNQCEINKDSLDLEFGRNGEVEDNEHVMGMVLCSVENQSELFLKEEIVEIPIEKDPLDLSEEDYPIKSEIEDTSDDYSEISSSKVIGSVNQVSIPIKCEYEDQLETVDTNDINRPRNKPTEAMTSNREMPAVAAELTHSVDDNTGCSSIKNGSCHISDNKCKDPTSWPLNDTAGIVRLSSGTKDINVKEQNVTNSIPNASHAEVNTNGCNLEMQTTKNSVKRIFACTECGKAFDRMSKLIVHTRTHSGEKPFVCKQCGKTFSEKGNLLVHMKIHSDRRPFKCKECSRSFRRKSNLMAHEWIHSGERSFICERCFKTFSEESKFESHMRNHSGKRPFICTECNKSFIQKSQLTAHIRIHSGEKPFVCKQCGKAFSEKGNLKVHIRTHTGERPFVCKDCGKTYCRRGDLTVHMRIHSAKKTHLFT